MAGPCVTNYTLVGESCINNLLLPPPCGCRAEIGWVLTACNSVWSNRDIYKHTLSLLCDQSDSKQCSTPGTTGTKMRYCFANGTWDKPDESGCILLEDACTLWPCDVNSLNCTVSGLMTNTSADRTCGNCRFGFQPQGDLCIDVEIQDVSVQPVALGNVANLSSTIATAMVQRQQNVQAVTNVLTFTSKVAQVSVSSNSSAETILNNVATIANALITLPPTVVLGAVQSVGNGTAAELVANITANTAVFLAPGATTVIGSC